MEYLPVYRVLLILKAREQSPKVRSVTLHFHAVEGGTLFKCCRFPAYPSVWLNRQTGIFFDESFGVQAPVIIGRIDQFIVSERIFDYWGVDEMRARIVAEVLKRAHVEGFLRDLRRIAPLLKDVMVRILPPQDM